MDQEQIDFLTSQMLSLGYVFSVAFSWLGFSIVVFVVRIVRPAELFNFSSVMCDSGLFRATSLFRINNSW